MTDDAAAVRPTSSQADEAEKAAVAAKRLTKFANAHGGAKFVYVEYVSANRTRIVVVTEDGSYGDQVLTSHQAALDACAQAGFEVLTGEWDRDAVGAVRTSGFEWGWMGRGRPAK